MHITSRSDPIEAVVAGVAFLGAGTIIRGRKSDVHGLTTAAALLFTAVIGVCTGLRELVLAGGATVLALATLRLVGLLEAKLKPKPPHAS
jgi:putative Mg2+ transporter-C (MgtC) family protein